MRLYLDACCIIYAVEGLPRFREVVLDKLAMVEATREGIVSTSRLSRLECRVKPIREKQFELLAHYEGFFERQLLLIDITAAVVERATELRAIHGFKTSDAIHLATAIEERADLFLTGDAALARCTNLNVEII